MGIFFSEKRIFFQEKDNNMSLLRMLVKKNANENLVSTESDQQTCTESTANPEPSTEFPTQEESGKFYNLYYINREKFRRDKLSVKKLKLYSPKFGNNRNFVTPKLLDFRIVTIFYFQVYIMDLFSCFSRIRTIFRPC